MPPQATSHPPFSLNVNEPSNWSLVRRLMALSWQYRRQMILILTIQTAILAMTVSGLGLAGLGIDAIRVAVDANAPTPKWPLGLAPPASWSSLAVMFAIAIAIIAITLANAALQNRYTVTMGRLVQQHVVVSLRKRVYDKLQRLSFRFFDANESGSIINRVTSDVQNVARFLKLVLFSSINLVIAMTFFLVLMLSIHVKLTLACMATIPILWVCTVVFSKLVRRDHNANRVAGDDLVLKLSENLQGVHVVKGFARQDVEMSKYRKANKHVSSMQNRIFWRVSIFSPLTILLTQVNMIVLLAYGGYLVMQRELDLGTGLVVFAGLLGHFSTEIQRIAGLGNRVQDSLSSAARVFEVLDTPLEIDSPPEPVTTDRFQGAVKFDAVAFGYRVGNAVLHDIDLEVQPGQCVAILGSTAGGKSTLLSLIPRFYDPTFGRVLIDGIDVKRMDVETLRRQIGIVFQESFLFSNTIASNIAFGHPEATQEQIEMAARIAAAHDFIMDLADGYETVIGERGQNLSGGQRQRLAIARAILMEPSILLLDDPTAAIDPETEHEILQSMDSAMQNRTTFVVAHRLSTLRRADHVVVLENGRIVQRGNHRDLMQASGHYRDTAQLQVADAESKRLLGVAWSARPRALMADSPS